MWVTHRSDNYLLCPEEAQEYRCRRRALDTAGDVAAKGTLLITDFWWWWSFPGLMESSKPSREVGIIFISHIRTWGNESAGSEMQAKEQVRMHGKYFLTHSWQHQSEFLPNNFNNFMANYLQSLWLFFFPKHSFRITAVCISRTVRFWRLQITFLFAATCINFLS